ncbi:hypothetical protein Pmani_000715 [Petrolisthes manimaculis]|uniref:Uncharacterized protein n=1 Tax=Petrolisthes manimaculis TaxID=1843537 RepID=A0AAE1QLF2_9EUCA|nr:hypothetical protein Pmani_000715 [Petrolisthes manimaculis]
MQSVNHYTTHTADNRLYGEMSEVVSGLGYHRLRGCESITNYINVRNNISIRNNSDDGNPATPSVEYLLEENCDVTNINTQIHSTKSPDSLTDWADVRWSLTPQSTDSQRQCHSSQRRV